MEGGGSHFPGGTTPQPTEGCSQPSRRASPASRWKWTAAGFGVVLCGLVLMDGADRRPADAARPVSLTGPTEPWPGDVRRLRLASFNIHSGRGADRRLDLGRTAAVLDEQLDVAGLNEVRAPWSGPDQAETLARHLGLAAAFAPAERQWWRDHFGNGILSRRPLAGILRCPLPGTRGKAFRNVVLAYLPFRDRTVKLLVTHIDREDDREHQLAAVIRLFLALEPPVVLMGDLNSTADDPQLVSLLARADVSSALHDGLPDGPPRGTIDWLFHRGLRTVSARLVAVDASDHPLLLAELALEDASDDLEAK